MKRKIIKYILMIITFNFIVFSIFADNNISAKKNNQIVQKNSYKLSGNPTYLDNNYYYNVINANVKNKQISYVIENFKLTKIKLKENNNKAKLKKKMELVDKIDNKNNEKELNSIQLENNYVIEENNNIINNENINNNIKKENIVTNNDVNNISNSNNDVNNNSNSNNEINNEDQNISETIIEQPIVTGTYNNTIAYEVLELINIEREKNNLSPLTLSSSLETIANIRAEEITRSWSHIRPDGTSWDTLYIEYSIYGNIGENLAYGQTTASEVVNDWMNSPSHKENILDPEFTQMAVSLYIYNGIYYWSQEFLG